MHWTSLIWSLKSLTPLLPEQSSLKEQLLKMYSTSLISASYSLTSFNVGLVQIIDLYLHCGSNFGPNLESGVIGHISYWDFYIVNGYKSNQWATLHQTVWFIFYACWYAARSYEKEAILNYAWLLEEKWCAKSIKWYAHIPMAWELA